MVPAPPADDPYGGSTDENTDSDEPIPPLPDFFVDKTFFLYGDFAAPERRLLQRYVTAFGGALAPYMSEKVTHVVTAQDWDETFEEALDVNPSLSFVRPRWVLACGERLRLGCHRSPSPSSPAPEACRRVSSRVIACQAVSSRVGAVQACHRVPSRVPAGRCVLWRVAPWRRPSPHVLPVSGRFHAN
ncbi:DNA repair protein XRCC1-like [Apteryx mantelli]|uniref:DNA repair protein XRCC1-like n=1 Tax=Apteryx mantelli TaxID=2696672 RepID=A0ABM4G780_9AVES